MSFSGRILHSISIVTTVIGTILIIVGFAAPYWRVWNFSSSSFGLWQSCLPICGTFKDPPIYLGVMKFPACFCLIWSIVSTIWTFYAKYYYCRSAVIFVAGGLGIAVSAVFIHFFPENAADGIKYGWAFILFFTGSLIMMYSSFITFFAGMLIHDED